MVEQITEKEIKVNEEGAETPSSGVDIWLIDGLSIGVLLCLGIALKRVIKWFKKVHYFVFCIYLGSIPFIFRVRGNVTI